jgi:hypothetical protein
MPGHSRPSPVFPNGPIPDDLCSIFRIGAFDTLESDRPVGTALVFTALGSVFVPGRPRWDKFVEVGAAKGKANEVMTSHGIEVDA